MAEPDYKLTQTKAQCAKHAARCRFREEALYLEHRPAEGEAAGREADYWDRRAAAAPASSSKQ